MSAPMRRGSASRIGVVFCALVACSLPTGCSGASGADVSLVQIRDDDMVGSFDPATLVISVGTEVRWRNDGERTHTVTTSSEDVAGEPAIPDGAEPWEPQSLRPGETFAHRFEVAGTYLYWSDEHRDGQMIGTITVEE